MSTPEVKAVVAGKTVRLWLNRNDAGHEMLFLSRSTKGGLRIKHFELHGGWLILNDRTDDVYDINGRLPAELARLL